MGAELFMWLGRCSSLMVFALGSLEVVPPLPPPPPAPQNILGAIFLFVVAMIIVAMVEIIGIILRKLDVLASGQVDLDTIIQYAKSIFEVFRMGVTQIGNIGKATIKPEHAAEEDK
jgi:hypothetical protein